MDYIEHQLQHQQTLFQTLLQGAGRWARAAEPLSASNGDTSAMNMVPAPVAYSDFLHGTLHSVGQVVPRPQEAIARRNRGESDQKATVDASQEALAWWGESVVGGHTVSAWQQPVPKAVEGGAPSSVPPSSVAAASVAEASVAGDAAPSRRAFGYSATAQASIGGILAQETGRSVAEDKPGQERALETLSRRLARQARRYDGALSTY